MDIDLRNDTLTPSRRTIAFLKLFARNYKELESGNGDFAKMMMNVCNS